MDPIITTDYGRAGGTLDATKHVTRQQPEADGYVNADAYNRPLDAWLKPNGNTPHGGGER